MKHDNYALQNLIANIYTKVVRKSTKEWKVVLICILLATIIWLLNALNKTYDTTMAIPVSFEYNKSRYIPLESLPKQIKINVSGEGWQLIKHSNFFGKTEIKIPLLQPEKTNQLNGNDLLPIVKNKIENVKVNYILTDSLLFAFDVVKTKPIVLLLDTSQIDYAEGYAAGGKTQVNTPIIEAEGPSTQLEKIPDTLSVSVGILLLDKTTEKVITLPVSVQNKILFTPSEITVKIPVIALESKKLVIPIELKNTPVSADLTTEDSVITVYYYVKPESNISASDFSAVANFEKWDSTSRSCPINISLPAEAQLIELKPEKTKIIPNPTLTPQ